MNNKIIVSMTSWPKRIQNVATVTSSLLDQDIRPDIIQINLSREEFPNESGLPDDLIQLIRHNPEVEIEWVDGNDGVFKKIIPTLKKHYGEDYLLLSVDDDWIYRHDYIKMMVEFLKKYDADAFCLFRPLIIGNRMIYKSSCFKSDFWEKLTQEVVSTRIDDTYIEHYLRSYNKKIAGFRPDDTPDITKRYNPVFPNSKNTDNGEYSTADVAKANKIIKSIKFV